MKVVKFGGSSLANGPQLEKVLNIMLADTDRKNPCCISAR